MAGLGGVYELCGGAGTCQRGRYLARNMTRFPHPAKNDPTCRGKHQLCCSLKTIPKLIGECLKGFGFGTDDILAKAFEISHI